MIRKRWWWWVPSALLALIGLGGVPDDLRTWAEWVTEIDFELVRTTASVLACVCIAISIGLEVRDRRRTAGASGDHPETITRFDAELIARKSAAVLVVKDSYLFGREQAARDIVHLFEQQYPGEINSKDFEIWLAELPSRLASNVTAQGVIVWTVDGPPPVGTVLGNVLREVPQGGE